MLLHIVSAGAVFFFHERTESFIGAESSVRPTVGPFEQAVDFELHSSQHAAQLAISVPGGKAFDIRGGTDGKYLIYYNMHKQDNQLFQLVFTAYGKYALMQEEKCLNWDEMEESFVKTDCTEAAYAEFTLLYEVSHEPPAEDPRIARYLPPPGTPEHALLSRVISTHEGRKGRLRDISEDISSRDLQSEAGDDEATRALKKLLLSNRPKRRRRGSSSSDESSDGCKDVSETLAHTVHQPKHQALAHTVHQPKHQALAHKSPRGGWLGAMCAHSDHTCNQVERLMKQTISKNQGRPRRPPRLDDSDCSNADIPNFLRREK
ncbi:hypothetical protein PAPHI01_0625 [Pancytospora philotis]|nr:hypothetical protein PAPHI01_0625 [Pancytospora philotis]